jgi:hypothetical protein
MHYLSSIYSITVPLQVLGLLVAHHQEVTMYIYTTNGTCLYFNWLSVGLANKAN